MNDDQGLEQFMIVLGCPSYCRRTLDHFNLAKLPLTVSNKDKIVTTDGELNKCALDAY